MLNFQQEVKEEKQLEYSQVVFAPVRPSLGPGFREGAGGGEVEPRGLPEQHVGDVHVRGPPAQVALVGPCHRGVDAETDVWKKGE